MSIEIVKSYYDAFNRKDVDAILSICHDDVINDRNQADSQTGKENLKNFLETAWQHFDEKVFNVDLMANHDQSNVAAEYLVKGTYYKTKQGLFPANNQYYEILCSSLFKVKNGKISRITRYYNVKQWLDIVNPNRVGV